MIRPYSKEDKNALVALLRLNTPLYFDESEENDFLAYLDNHLDNYFIVEENGEIIGSGGINYFPEEKLARISWDIIHPDYQGKGIGTKLTKYRIDEIRKNQSINSILVRTTQLVYKFYQKLGFKLEKTEKDFWAKGFDLYQMRLELELDQTSFD
ncbi:GNAT family N-acetyltransferase [Pontibacter vulgaris]|uniref:GNAT family N-acetyltransferase n=1 Tax=Pontibacter vulgaris TaxID=2905679 RepID=UPI001FA7A1A6|nr:GNAT family N-acetyltransferase [Pontibacter vulgaris]